MSNTVSIYIDGRQYAAAEEESLFEVAKRNGIAIPSLCYEESLAAYGACRLCLVEVEKGAKKGITTSCTLAPVEGLAVKTNTDEVKKHRKIILELYLAQSPESKKIKRLAEEYGVYETRFKKEKKENDPLNNSCVLCGLCVRVCNEVMKIGVINFIGRGYRTCVNTPYFESSPICIGCKACLFVCPADAITITDMADIRLVSSWSQTKVELKKCTKCGKYYTPAPLKERVNSLSSFDLDEEIKDICPQCRKKYQTAKVTHIIANKVGEYAE